MCNILQDDGTHQSITFDRRFWNDFVDGSDPILFGETRVVVSGEDEYNCSILLASEEDLYLGDRDDLVDQAFDPQGDDDRGTWGYLLPSGASAFKCKHCGEIVAETYEQTADDDRVTTEHECPEVDGKPQGAA